MREATKAKYDIFCREFVGNCGNGAEAAREAGYSEKSARKQALDLLKIPYIIDKIRQIQTDQADKHCEKLDISVEKRIGWLKQAMEYGFRDIPVSAMDKDAGTKAENLSASIAAVKEMNAMLGATDTSTVIVHNIMPVPVADSADDWESLAKAHQEKTLGAV